MRAEGGRVALLERHLERLGGSAAALGLEGIASPEAIRAAVGEALAAAAPGPLRVRVCATPRPTLLIEVTAEPPLGDLGVASAVALPGAWIPGNRIAEHKTLSYAGHRWSQRRAEAQGAGHALLLDARGNLGEAAIASVFCVVGGELLSAPADGLLAGVARAVVMDSLPVREQAPALPVWRAADEIVLTNARRGAIAVTAVDGTPVGCGAPGPVARRIHAALTAAMTGGA